MAAVPQVATTIPRLKPRAVTAASTSPASKQQTKVKLSGKSLEETLTSQQRRKIAQVVQEIVRVEGPKPPPRGARNFLPDWLKPYQKKFQPGVSGNPNGRPRRAKLTAALKALAAEVEESTGLTYAELTAMSLYYAAINKGNVLAAREIREATEGKLPETFSVDMGATNNDAGVKQRLLQKLSAASGASVVTTTQTISKSVTRLVEGPTGNTADIVVDAAVMLPIRQLTSQPEQR